VQGGRRPAGDLGQDALDRVALRRARHVVLVDDNAPVAEVTRDYLSSASRSTSLAAPEGELAQP
jgi:hypothetical protein